MNKYFSEIFQVLIDNNDIHNFKKFLQSRFFSVQKVVLELVEVLEKDPDLLDEKQDKITKQEQKKKVFNSIAPNKMYNSNFLSKRIHATKNAILEFLRLTELKEQNESDYKWLAKAFNRRGQYQLMEKTLQNYADKISEEKVRDSSFYREHQYINEQIYFHPEHEKLKNDDPYLINSIENLDRYYVLAKLRLTMEVLNNQLFSVQSLPDDLLEDVEAVAEKCASENKIFNLYLKIIDLLKQKKGNAEQLRTTIQLYYETIEQLSKQENRKIFVVFINYALHLYHQGQTEMMHTIFEIYKMAEQQQLLIWHNRMTVFTFNNVVAAAILTKHTAFAERFIYNYKHCLQSDEKVIIVNLAKAQIAFSKNEFRKVITILSVNNKVTDKYRIIRDLFLMRSEFMLHLIASKTITLEVSEELKGINNRFRDFIKRSVNIHSLKKSEYIEFCRVFNELVAILSATSNQQRKRRISRAGKILEEASAIVARNWLVEVIQHFHNLNKKRTDRYPSIY